MSFEINSLCCDKFVRLFMYTQQNTAGFNRGQQLGPVPHKTGHAAISTFVAYIKVCVETFSLHTDTRRNASLWWVFLSVLSGLYFIFHNNECILWLYYNVMYVKMLNLQTRRQKHWTFNNKFSFGTWIHHLLLLVLHSRTDLALIAPNGAMCLLSTVHVHTTKHCRFYRGQQLGPVPHKTGHAAISTFIIYKQEDKNIGHFSWITYWVITARYVFDRCLLRFTLHKTKR
jgi:hypothetical protein